MPAPVLLLDLRQYNGNISAIKWSKSMAASADMQMAYNFKYDRLNRLLNATHLESETSGFWSTGQYDEGGLAYDLNGNIKSLLRKGDNAATIDNLTYNYGTGTTASNKLAYVTDNTADATNKTKGFFDGNTSGGDYSYDDNGNMILDKNKGITTNISYNFLNLPAKVVKSTGSLVYIYDATGQKHGQLASFGAGSDELTEYIGPWVFENNEIQFLQHDEGRVVMMEEEIVFQSECDASDDLTATTGVTLAPEVINGETFVKVTGASGTSLSKRGVTLSTIFTVGEGERYLFKVKGYRNAQNVHLYVKGNASDLIWAGAALTQGATKEIDVEQTFTIPPGITQLTLGILWNSSNTAGDYFYLNQVELRRLSTADPEY